ncbi:MAG: PEP-CTERM sorting domain-containing protein [Fimbriimonadaceae bacterium]
MFGFSGSALAQIPYSTSFEASDGFIAGGSVNGVGGWANGSGGGGSHSVSTAQAFTGSQSIVFDNSGGNISFYSVRRALNNDYTLFPVITVSTRLYLDGSTGADRLYSLLGTGSATGTMGGTILGVSVGGDGRVRAGNTWAATYTVSGVIGQFTTGHTGRWLTLSFTYNSFDRSATATASNGTESFTWSGTAGGTANVLNFNLGSDYDGTVNRTGIGYFDDVQAVPEPATLAALGLGALALMRRRRTK